MSLFKWSSDYSVYLPEIDAEHRAIFRLGDELHRAVLAGAKPGQLKPIVMNLLEAEEQHFRHEERLMSAMHYSGFAWHKKQHDTARKRTKALVKDIEANDRDAASEVMLIPFELAERPPDGGGPHDGRDAAQLSLLQYVAGVVITF